MKTGTVEKVYDAIRQGVSDVEAIATWLSLEREQVHNALKRLVDSKRVRKAARNQYVPNSKPLLSDVW